MARRGTLEPEDPGIRLALRAARIGVWSWDLGADRLRWSEEVFHTYGLDPGGPAPSVEGFLALLPDDERGRVGGIIREFVARADPGAEYLVRYRYVTPSGEERWIQGSGCLTVDPGGAVSGMLGVCLDVTDQHRREQEIGSYRAILERAGVGVAQIHTPTGRFQRVNRRYQELVGYTEAELQQRTFMDISLPEELPEDLARMEQLVAGEIDGFGLEKRLVRKDGSHLWVGLTVSPMWSPGSPQEHHVAVIQDIDARRRAEAERQDLERRVLHAQKLESLGVLAGGIAHDFNNLLLAIQGNADLALLDLPGDARARLYVNEIRNAARRAAGLCHQMLAYSGRGNFVIEHLDVDVLVEEMVRILAVSVSKKAELRLELAGHLPLVRADATQLRQVMMNLVTNASEALEDRPGRITVRTGLADLRPEDVAVHPDSDLPAGRYVSLEVADSGCGMDAATRERMFDPFYSTKFAGRGLGMAAVLGIVSGHRGSLSVESEPGEGTSIRVLLPATSESSAPPRPEVVEPGWKGRGTVLVVDDEPLAREVARRMLERLGLQVLVAEDGYSALDLLAGEHAIDCLLLDLTMPGMDGMETLRAVRQIPCQVPVILTSGYTAEEVSRRYQGAGFAGFLPKPYEVADLRERLQVALAAAS